MSRVHAGTLWARREVRRRAAGHTRFNHPLVGQLELRYEKLLRPEAQQLLVVYHADQGSPSAARLQLLTSL
ncbi:MmyB family transcriptional regulator [Streptomyces antibioticus]|uniref:MmyB family transcriptional regulator n=1 Tax=Streptomyces antibioticus TaxID=1890 RepID=UPI00340192BF